MAELTAAQHTGLAFLLQAQEKEQRSLDASRVEIKVVRNAPAKESKKQTTKHTGAQAAPIHNRPAIFGVALPDRNSLDAKGFLLAIRDAGKRPFEVQNEVTGEVYQVIKVDPGKVREDMIKAIHAFIGFDPSKDFGVQEIAARAAAQRQLRGPISGKTREEQRAADRSLSGFVAGLPDNSARQLADLQAREVAATDAMLQHLKDSEDMARSPADRLLSQGLAEVERERIHQIRQHIKTMGF